MKVTLDKSTKQLSIEDELFQPELKPSYWVNQSTSLINMAQDLTITL